MISFEQGEVAVLAARDPVVQMVVIQSLRAFRRADLIYNATLLDSFFFGTVLLDG